ncbi:MAG: sensor histidine kinase, partial [Bacteroidota bacterium]|nr:sensor histidine kinase [Bacteroidota bacterium]
RANAVKITVILLNTILLFLFAPNTYAQKKVKEGFLDLRNEQLRNKIIKLNGEWEFYWNKHLLPSDFTGGDLPSPDTWGIVPSYWISYSNEIPEIENTGYATYRMNILFPENIRTIMFDIPVFDAAFRIYIDGNYAGGNGLAGESEEETKPGYDPFTYEHTITDALVEVIVNVSNYHHRRGGFWMPMKIGTPEVMTKNLESHKILSGVSAGILLSFIVFFLLFYLIFRGDYSMLFFSLGTLGILLRSISTGSFLIMTFTNIDWSGLIRLEYTGSFLALIFAAWYFYRIFPDKYFKVISTIVTVLFLSGLILVLASPVSIFSNSIRIFTPAVILILLYYGVKSIISLLKARSEGILNTIGFVALLTGAVNDIALSGSDILIFGSYILPYATIIFIFMQVIILISRWVNSFNEEKRLLTEVEYVNQNLEKIVSERTSELTNQKSELQEQKEEIEAKNKELEKSIHTKNRVFSIIGHDLKTPLVNLAILIENMKNISDEKKHESLTEEISKQVDFTINLIDNLITWGQSQQNQIDYRPGKWNITDIVLECFNLLNARAELKDIQLSYSHRGSPVALCDRTLLFIVLRNLMTNAIKFTPDRGKIYVSVEEVVDVDPHLRISVKDTGVGMDHETMENLERNKITKSTAGTRDEKGTGLGLQLCYDLVKVNNGEMFIESTKGEGTTVSFTLPSPS